MAAWRNAAEVMDRVPSGVWLVLILANVILAVTTLSTARRRMRRAGERAAHPELISQTAKTRDTALTVAAMIPAGLFWAMVLAGSFHGLVAFGHNMVDWHNGWEDLVPGTLDGVSVTFAFLAFRAVRKQKAPDRCYRVVWGAALASATVNFAYEYTRSAHNVIAGGYLALLSLFGMVMLHEFLDQFEEGTAYVKRGNPKFGLRWITWPTNTFCAAVAWRNYPPVEGTPATVLTALANLGRVRKQKHTARKAKTHTRHERALEAARRRAELAAAKAGTRHALEGVDKRGNKTVEGGHRATPPTVPPEPASAPDSRGPLAAQYEAGMTAANGAPTVGQLPQGSATRCAKVPTMAATVAQWADTWIQMCADGARTLGPLNDEDTRARYGLTARQLRNIRNAATSGALRRRAGELALELPRGYVESPLDNRVNGRTSVREVV